ncbi:hypothetical protein [Streptomyces otsuchiensis]|uniref:hypothetical protein n=1 Tax=Streptomyces otsuchiensis TaxID=2681388 RepID=UPI0013002D10|nr:hypothetical protein [Streptomyces otsuchiensis]
MTPAISIRAVEQAPKETPLVDLNDVVPTLRELLARKAELARAIDRHLKGLNRR